MDLLRRRNMMQGMGNISPYPDPWIDDGKIWAYYNVTTTASATNLLYDKYDFSSYEIDGTSYSISGAGVLNHTFGETGTKLVKFTPKNAKLANSCWRGNTNPPVLRVYIPSSITTLSNATFYSVDSLTGVYGCLGITTLGPTVFLGNRNLKSDVNLPSLSQLSKENFTSGFGNVVNLGVITSIPTGNFVSGSAGINAICSKIILPETLQSIGNGCIMRVYNLRELIVKAVTPPSLGTNSFEGMSNFVIKVPSESVEAYKAASGWSRFANKIQAIV